MEGRRGPRALSEWLQRMRVDATARTAEAVESAQIRLESDTRALKLITIHKSKGLQFPVVVCPYLWDGMGLHPSERDAPPFHDPANGDRLTIDLGSKDAARHRQLAEREALAEKLRLLYVALSRAEQLCIVAWGAFKSCETSALGYVLHQPAASDVRGDLIAATRRRICELSDVAMRAELERLAVRAEGTIEVVDLHSEPPPRYAQAADDGPAPALRHMRREVRQGWRMASFSALASSQPVLPEPAEEGVDQDELADAMPATGMDEPPTLRGFPRGRRLGNLVHKLFETIDFTARDAAALQAHALRWLPVYGIETSWSETLCAAITDVLDTPLADRNPPLTLRGIPTARRLDELEFVFPVGLDGDEEPVGSVRAASLADAFAAYGAGWLSGYATRLRRLPFSALSGYLKGYIDLVFSDAQRWYIVDYKTNDLGDRCEHYAQAPLLAEMMRHHYVLQYHLYCVAVHRYLAQRLAGYAYERHFGGVFYLFVRGMAPAHEPGCGIFFDRPPAALIGALSELFAHPVDTDTAAP
jgi:exodeoxyribonuclease V beta subunit